MKENMYYSSSNFDSDGDGSDSDFNPERNNIEAVENFDAEVLRNFDNLLNHLTRTFNLLPLHLQDEMVHNLRAAIDRFYSESESL